MQNYKNVILFYRRIFIIILLVNAALYFLLGMYLANYEVFFSALLHGTYTQPWGIEVDLSSHLLILFVYEFFAAIFKDYNVYGFILVVYNFLGFIFTGLVLFRILKINLKIDSLMVFLLLYLILILDNFINLSSTRQTFIFLVAIAGFIESRRAESKPISAALWGWITVYYLLVNLIRFESVWLFSWIYLLAALLLRKFNKFVLLPLLISGVFLVIFYNILVPQLSVPKQAFIYKELEFFDRMNVDYDNIPEADKREVDAIMLSGIQDTKFFTLAFYDSISKYNSNNNILSLSDGIEVDAFRHTLHQSLQHFKKSFYYIFFYLLVSFLMIWFWRPFKKRNILYVIVIFAIPFALCLHVVVPIRFLVPYYTSFSVLNIFIIYRQPGKPRIFNSLILIFVIICAFKCWLEKKDYLKADLKFRNTSARLQKLSSGQPDPVIINSFYYDGYFPVDPLCRFPRQNAMFLNFYYFTGWDLSLEKWKAVCHCNPLSYKEKVNYIVSNQNLFIIDPASFEYMQKFMKDKYGLLLGKTDIGYFNADLYVCRLKYNSKIVY